MEKAILVGIDNNKIEFDIDYSLNELERLAKEIKIHSVYKLVQKGEINKKTYIGQGKVEELLVEIKMYDANVVIFNDELSPLMIKNLSEILNCKIIDRALLILEIFKQNAKTSGAKLEIKLANLKYLYPRLSSLRDGFDRQGGINSKGSGETQLELDRRYVANEITRLEEKLRHASKIKESQIKHRKKQDIKTVALVGYTNAGKSSTLNTILEYTKVKEDKKVLSEDRLFATLDTKVRKINYNNTSFLLTDTIGFVSKIPNNLIYSFKETLLEASYADLILIVLDASSKYAYIELQTTMSTLYELGFKDKKMLLLLNKVDKCEVVPKISGIDCMTFSNITLENIDNLLNYITNFINKDLIELSLNIPYSEGKILSFIKENTQVISMLYNDDGVFVNLKCDKKYYKMLSIYEPLNNDLTS